MTFITYLVCLVGALFKVLCSMAKEGQFRLSLASHCQPIRIQWVLVEAAEGVAYDAP